VGIWTQCQRDPMHPAPAPAAGWFPDPSGRHELRYWSGTIWTEHVADAGQGSIDRLVGDLQRANTPEDWIKRRRWHQWDHPANAVRGESKYQDVISDLPGVTPGLVEEIRVEPVEVEFVREPDNPYDQFACRAVVAGHMVGYLARECASVLAPQVDAAGVKAWTVCGAVVGGSYGADRYGVHVWLDRLLTIGPHWAPQADMDSAISYLGPHLFGDVLRGGDRGYLHCAGEEFVAALDHSCPDCSAGPLEHCRTVQGNVSLAIHSARLELGEEANRREAASLSQSDGPPMREGESVDRYHKRTGQFPPHWTSYRRRYQEALFDEARSTGNRQYLTRWGIKP
jgi:hypothetical protein